MLTIMQMAPWGQVAGRDELSQRGKENKSFYSICRKTDLCMINVTVLFMNYCDSLLYLLCDGKESHTLLFLPNFP